jgi:hypothetical protein
VLFSRWKTWKLYGMWNKCCVISQCFSDSFTGTKKIKSKWRLAKHKAQIPAKEGSKDRPEFKAAKRWRKV